MAPVKTTDTPAPDAAPAAPAMSFTVLTPPKSKVGRRKRELDMDFLTAYAAALTSAADGDVVAINQSFTSRVNAQAKSTRLRKDLAEASLIATEKSARARIWEQKDGTWAFGLKMVPVAVETPAEDAPAAA